MTKGLSVYAATKQVIDKVNKLQKSNSLNMKVIKGALLELHCAFQNVISYVGKRGNKNLKVEEINELLIELAAVSILVATETNKFITPEGITSGKK